MRRIFKEFFDMDDAEFDKAIERTANLVEKAFGFSLNEDDEKDEKTGSRNSYAKLSGRRYEDGELCEKYDKEFVNGKCTKDEHYSKAVDEGDKKSSLESEASKEETSGNENNGCTEKIAELNQRIDEMTHYIDGLNDKIKSLSVENEKLHSVIDNIKNCF